MNEREQGPTETRTSVYKDVASSGGGPLLAFTVTLARLGSGQDMSTGVFTALLFAAVAVGAGFGGRGSALATAALAGLGLLLSSDEAERPATALTMAALLTIALVTGELRDRAERADRAAEVANQRLKRVALRDALTGLFDRRGFEYSMGVEIARETRRSGSFALLLLELSGVKAAGDRFGRSVGDTLIQVLADAIEQRIRQSDTPSRVSDDQFAVILPDTNAAGAEVIAGQILARFLDDLRGIVPGDLVARGSFAVAIFPADGSTADALLTSASRRLESPR
jgi:diguanylate cyclase (GGDEF)-like protein